MLTKREVVLIALTALLMGIPLAIVASQNRPAPLPSSVAEWNAAPAVPTKVGERRQFWDTPTATLDNLEIHATTIRTPGEYAHAAHQHPDEELLVVRDGTIEVLVNGETQRVGPGSLVFQAPNQLHSIRNVGTTPATYHVLRWRTAKTGAAAGSTKP